MTIEDIKVIIQGDETELTVETIKQSHHSYPQNPTIADVLFKTTFLENWGSGVGRMVDACKKANLSEPEFNPNAAFVWVTFKRSTIQAYNPTTSKDNRFQKLKTFFSIIGENGANLKMLMEGNAIILSDEEGQRAIETTLNSEENHGVSNDHFEIID